ncbi:iron chelate uptake ABC transporter family permease subunit [Nocardia sp.]|uniref:iron chelate uptake ABC transporter family permease subunit n=1 Tax=Nocardia sp. TaxID=1821 RepID=UPI00338EA5EB
MITLALANRRGELAPTRTVLAGLAVSYLCSAATSFVIFWSATGDSYREILSWLLGSLSGASWADVVIVSVAVVVVGGVLLSRARTLDAFAFGDGTAATLGVDVNATRWTLLTLVALLTGAAVAVSGAAVSSTMGTLSMSCAYRVATQACSQMTTPTMTGAMANSAALPQCPAARCGPVLSATVVPSSAVSKTTTLPRGSSLPQLAAVVATTMIVMIGIEIIASMP